MIIPTKNIYKLIIHLLNYFVNKQKNTLQVCTHYVIIVLRGDNMKNRKRSKQVKFYLTEKEKKAFDNWRGEKPIHIAIMEIVNGK